MNSTTNFQPIAIQTGEKPFITDANEDYVLEQLRSEIEQIKTEIGNTEKSGLAGKLGFKKMPKNATISVGDNPITTSSMTEVIPPSPDLLKALTLAEPAAPVDPHNLILDSTRMNEVNGALAASARTLTGALAPEAQVVRQPAAYSTVTAGERLQTPIDMVRGYTADVTTARAAVVGMEVQ